MDIEELDRAPIRGEHILAAGDAEPLIEYRQAALKHGGQPLAVVDVEIVRCFGESDEGRAKRLQMLSLSSTHIDAPRMGEDRQPRSASPYVILDGRPRTVGSLNEGLCPQLHRSWTRLVLGPRRAQWGLLESIVGLAGETPLD